MSSIQIERQEYLIADTCVFCLDAQGRTLAFPSCHSLNAEDSIRQPATPEIALPGFFHKSSNYRNDRESGISSKVKSVGICIYLKATASAVTHWRSQIELASFAHAKRVSQAVSASRYQQILFHAVACLIPILIQD
ncbi:uncharacterized protein RSE6_10836 [Rhynchosporium secalis]|uniref:Uncharacterized protein n=1 Tax=Rhynchosporium secalis TaxID=38038 RepID=A0A1E1MLI1_RHYSE|nr:uncharacterized protein RSE6_10836 [Rhynchosporium secalis]